MVIEFAENKSARAAFAARLVSSSRLLLVAHTNPDADAIASLSALYYFLAKNGKSVDILCSSPFPLRYRQYCAVPVLTAISTLDGYDSIIALDTPNAARLGLPAPWTADLFVSQSAGRLCVLDHHIDNQNFGSINYVSEHSATAETLYDLFTAELPQFSISAECRNALLLGILGDTGGLRHNNTKPQTLRNVAELIEAGADFSGLIRMLFSEMPLGLLKLEGDVLNCRTTLHAGGRFACATIPQALLDKYGLSKSDTDFLIDRIRQIAGTEIVAAIYETQDAFKASLRSKNPAISVRKIANQLGGGGHELAAGCTIHAASIEEAEQQLTKLIERDCF